MFVYVYLWPATLTVYNIMSPSKPDKNTLPMRIDSIQKSMLFGGEPDRVSLECFLVEKVVQV